jgi:HK97 gp10 family phage protein
MTVRNADRLIRKLQKLPLDARASIGTALAGSVVTLDSYAKQKIQGGGRGGRVYRRRSVARQSSAPGEFPKSDSGQLVGSLFFKISSDKLRAFFGTKLAYGRYLEFGTSRMQARPWLRPTFKANREKIVERVRAAVQEALRKARG